MSSKFKAHFNHIPHFITCTVIHWIDALSRPEYKEIILDSLRYCIAEKGLLVHAWVIMPNHLHLIVSTVENATISGIVRDFKKFTSRKIIEAIKNNEQESRRIWLMRAFEKAGKQNGSNFTYQFWQQDFHPIELNTHEKWIQRLNYLHENPVRAGIVWREEDYKYSSATDYFTEKLGLLPVNKF